MTECAIVKDEGALLALAGDWERLAASNPRPTVFLSHAWATISAKILGAPRVVVARQSGKVAGILPLRLDGASLRFLGAPFSDYNDLLCAPGADRAEILAASLAAIDRMGFRACTLENVWEGSLLLGALGSLPPRLLARVHAVPSAPCPRVVVPDGEPGFFASLAKKDSLKRPDNKLKKTGNVTFGHLEDRERILSHLPAFFEQHMGRRDLAGDKSLFHEESARAFFRALVETFDPRGPLRFAVLELDGKAIAYHLGFEEAGTFVWYKPAFDAELAKLSPGSVLLRRLFEHSGEKGLKVFDFTIGDEEFKRRHATAVLTAHRVFFYPGGLRGSLPRVVARWKERLKGHPRLYRLLKRLAGRE